MVVLLEDKGSLLVPDGCAISFHNREASVASVAAVAVKLRQSTPSCKNTLV